jgi:iron complex outermembrane receptor protein
VARRQITPWLSEIKAQYGHSYVDHVMDNFTLANKTAMMAGQYSVKNPDRETDTAKLEATLDFAQVRV